MKKRGYTVEVCKQLMQEMMAYRAASTPFNAPCPVVYGNPDNDLIMVRGWWTSLPSAAASPLVNLAILLLDIVPHAAAPERLFSMLGWFQGKLRARLGVCTTGMMAVVRSHYQRLQSELEQARAQREGKRSAAQAAAQAVEPDSDVEVEEEPAEPTEDVDDDDVLEGDVGALDEALAAAHTEDVERRRALSPGDSPRIDIDALLQFWTQAGVDVAAPNMDPFEEHVATPAPMPLGGMAPDAAATAAEDFDVRALVADFAT
jgi:hypothetical protein